MAMHEYRPRYLERLSVEVGERRVVVDLDETDRIEAVGDVVKVHAGNRAYQYDAPLALIMGELDPAVFVQVSDAIVVNLDGVTDFDLLPSGACRLTLRDGSTVDASPSHRARLNALTFDPKRP